MTTITEHQAADRIIVIVGTRPEAIKLAPVILSLRELGIVPLVCMTGQHQALAAEALGRFNIFGDHTLPVRPAGPPLSACNERAVAALAAFFVCARPSWVVVQGDTSSALCAALAARQVDTAIAHVEAGLRSFDLEAPFPEEINRTLIAILAHLHFAPTQAARENLIREGVPDTAIEVTGNTVVDALRWVERQTPAAQVVASERRLIVATAHRRENRGEGLANIVAALTALAARGDTAIIMPVHPSNPHEVLAPLAAEPAARLVAPMAHANFVRLLARAHLVVTDSGGVQEEASALGVPTLVTRRNTERPEVVEAGTAKIVGTATADIFEAATRLLDDPAARDCMAQASTRIGDGNAGLRIARRLQRRLAAPGPRGRLFQGQSSAGFDCS